MRPDLERAAILVLIFAVTAALAQGRPAPPAEDVRAGLGRPGWSVDVRTACWIWNSDPKLGDTVQWTGSCEPDGRAVGDGVAEWRTDGKVTARYEGQYRDGKAHGRGVFTFPRGVRYVGEFRDDKFNGRGLYIWPSGNRYEGEFRDGKMNGQGVYTMANGNRHIGEYRDGKRNGRGVATWPTGERFEGEYRDDNRNGRGVSTWANGDRYVGEFRDDRPDGRGLFTVANGNRYEGEWRQGCFRDGERRAAIGRPLSDCP